MPVPNYMLVDLLSGSLATLLFVFIALIPGYVVSWAVDLFSFRARTVAWRFVVATSVGLTVVPGLAFLLDWLLGAYAVWAALGVSFAACLVTIVLDLKSRRLVWGFSRTSLAFVAIAAGWFAIALFSLSDLQLGRGIYLSGTVYDHNLRASVVDSLHRTSLSQPLNPMHHVGGDVSLRYHFFWFLLCSLVQSLGSGLITARHALYGSIVWCGWGLGCCIAMFLRYVLPRGEEYLVRRSLVGLGLLMVTGLDIIPTMKFVLRGDPLKDMEWWNEQITSWVGSLLWVPNHVGGLIAGITGFLILWCAGSAKDTRSRIPYVIVGGLAFASMLGESIYVGFVFAFILSLWTIVTWIKGWRNHSTALASAGILTVVFALPYLQTLMKDNHGDRFVVFSIRGFPGAQVFSFPERLDPGWLNQLYRLTLLPANLLFELGFFLLVGAITAARIWKKRTLDIYDAAALAILLPSFLIPLFLRSAVISNNDLGWRGFLPAQFILLIWAAEMLTRETVQSKLVRYALIFTMALGLVGSVYSICGLRFRQVVGLQLAEQDLVSPMQFSVRRVYEDLRESTPRTVILQSNPAWVLRGLYADRQTAVGDVLCGASFGGDSSTCEQVLADLRPIFNDATSPEYVRSMAKKYDIDGFIIDSEDPIWEKQNSWIWQEQPTITEKYARAFLLTPPPQNGTSTSATVR
jgi:hypothetical protein